MEMMDGIICRGWFVVVSSWYIRRTATSHLHIVPSSSLCYASRYMLNTEQRYSESGKHALSLIFCVENFKHYLIGQHFVIITNNGLAKQDLQSSHPLGRLAKWLAILQEYDFSFKIVKWGCSNLKNALIDLGENLEVNLLSTISIDDPWYGGIYNFLCTFSFPPGCTSY